MTTNAVTAQHHDDEWAERDEAEQERFLALLAETPPFSLTRPEILRHEYENPTPQTQPTVGIRDDGQALFMRGRINALQGESEACKTMIAIHFVVQELRAGNAVLVADLEDSYETWVERLRQQGATVDEVAEGFIYINVTGAFDDVGKAHLQANFQRVYGAGRSLTLAVIDSVTPAMDVESLDPNLGKDVAHFHRGLPTFLKGQRAAVVLIDHVTKSHESRGRWAIGSERKISGLDGTAITAELNGTGFGRGETARVKLKVAKDRGGYLKGKGTALGVVTLVSDPETGAITVTWPPPEQARLADESAEHEARRQAVVAVLRNADGGMTSSAIGEALGGRRPDALITELVGDGILTGPMKDGRKKLYFLSDPGE